MRVFLLATAVAVAAPCAYARATDVAVRVLGVASDAGVVRVAVCKPPEFLKQKCTYNAKAPARRGEVAVTVRGVPPGVYAVQVYHDANNSGTVDRNFLGIPVEGIGFSHDAPMNLGPPRFADAALSVAGALVTTDIHLKFEP